MMQVRLNETFRKFETTKFSDYNVEVHKLKFGYTTIVVHISKTPMVCVLF